MRKYLLTLMILSFCGWRDAWCTSAPYEYVPLVREGVEWGYYCYRFHKDKPEEIESHFYRLRFDGSEILTDEWRFNRLYILKDDENTITESTPFIFLHESYRNVDRILNRDFKPNKFNPNEWFFDGIYDICDINGFTPLYWFVTLDGERYSTVTIEGKKRKILLETYFLLNKYPGLDIPDVRVIEGIGPVPKVKNCNWGNLAFPFVYCEPDVVNQHVFLYERRLDTGEIVFKGPFYDEYIAGDPTVSGIEGVSADVTERLLVTTDGLTVHSESSDTPLTLYRADGSTAATGIGTVSAPAAGLYIVASPGVGSRKVMLR